MSGDPPAMSPAELAYAQWAREDLRRRSLGRPKGPPDVGGKPWGMIAWIVLLASFVAVFVSQQSKVNAPPPSPRDQSVSFVSFSDPFALQGRLMVKMVHFFKSSGGSPQQTQTLVDQLRSQVQPSEAFPVRTRMAAIPFKAEFQPAEDTVEQIETLMKIGGWSMPGTKDFSEQDEAFLRVGRTLRQIYSDGNADGISQEDRKDLVFRLGYAGELALTFGKTDDPTRNALIGGGWKIVMLGTTLIAGILIALGVGTVLLIIGVARASTGSLIGRLERAAPGGSIGIETAALFVAGFFGVKLVTQLVASVTSLNEDQLQLVALGLQWLLLPLVLLWPKVRGFDWTRSRQALGLHSGSGVVKEIGAGFIGYLACVPLYALGVVMALIVLLLQAAVSHIRGEGGAPMSGPTNPIIEMAAGSSPMLLITLFFTATIWAPIVEEIVFRGGLLRQLDSRIPFLIAAIVTGGVFALMHGYNLMAMPILIMLATGFAMIRWWRGSLIACMVAHFLQNFLVSILMLAGWWAIG
jgi:membrane protease YdiL (CAAX protease family)